MAPKNSKTKTSPFVLVRTYAAGVHVGTLAAADGKTVTLTDARRVWRWRGANTLNELSQHGADTVYSRISDPVPSITLLDAIEIIPCSAIAAANLATSRWPS